MPFLLDLHLFLSRPLTPAPVQGIREAADAAQGAAFGPSSIYGAFPQASSCCPCSRLFSHAMRAAAGSGGSSRCRRAVPFAASCARTHNATLVLASNPRPHLCPSSSSTASLNNGPLPSPRPKLRHSCTYLCPPSLPLPSCPLPSKLDPPPSPPRRPPWTTAWTACAS
jgi:hypothetical protein